MFSEEVTIELKLSSNQTQESVAKIIENAHFLYGSTNTVSALRTVKVSISENIINISFTNMVRILVSLVIALYYVSFFTVKNVFQKF